MQASKKIKDNCQKPSKMVWIGEIDPRIRFEQVRKFFLSRGLKLQFNTRNRDKTKNYLVVTALDSTSFHYLTQIEKEHSIRGLTFKTDVYLTGNKKYEKDAEEARRRIYVGNLPAKTKNNDLRNFFSQFGKVKTAYVKNPGKDRKANKRTFRYGFVTFVEANLTETLIKTKFFNFKGKKIFVRGFNAKRTEDKANGNLINRKKEIESIKYNQQEPPRDVQDGSYHQDSENENHHRAPHRSIEEVNKWETMGHVNSQGGISKPFRKKSRWESINCGFDFVSSSFKEPRLLGYLRDRHWFDAENALRLNRSSKEGKFDRLN